MPEEDLFNFAADLAAMEPSYRSHEFSEHRPRSRGERLASRPRRDFQVSGLDSELDLAEGVGGISWRVLQSEESGGRLIFLGEGQGEVAPERAASAGKKRFSRLVPDLEGLVVFLGSLVDATEGLEDVEEVGAGGFSRAERTFRKASAAFSG